MSASFLAHVNVLLAEQLPQNVQTPIPNPGEQDQLFSVAFALTPGMLADPSSADETVSRASESAMSTMNANAGHVWFWESRIEQNKWILSLMARVA